LDSVVNTQIPSTRSRLDGVSTSKDVIFDKILELLKKRPHTPTELTYQFHYNDRTTFSKNYIYPLRDAGKIVKVQGSNHFQLPKQKNTTNSIRKALLTESEIFKTENFKKWIDNNTSKNVNEKHVSFANICLGIKNPKFKIHPDEINPENWKSITKNIVDALLEVADYEILNGEPHYSLRQAIRGFLMDGVGVTIPKKVGINLRISGRKNKPKVADLHITKEQVEQAKKLLLKRNVDPQWFVKFGVKTWTFVRPSTIYLIELANMEFYDEEVKYVLGQDDSKITDPKVIEYAEFKGDKIHSFVRRVCHIDVHENKTDSDFDKYILDKDFVDALEKYYNIRKSQRKRYLFWDDNKTEFTFDNYIEIVYYKVRTDNIFYKKILGEIGFTKSDFGTYFRANYGFRHFGLQMWLIATDYNYELVGEMSHEDTATLKKWYGKRTQKQFQKKISGVMA